LRDVRVLVVVRVCVERSERDRMKRVVL